jgi:hypothetical protein
MNSYHYNFLVRKSPLLIFTLSVAVAVGLISTPASANTSNSQCRFNGEFKGKEGQLSACIWSDVGKGKWIKFPKRNYASLTAYEKTKFLAYREIQKLYKSGPLSSISHTYFLSKNLPTEFKSRYVNQTERAAKYYDQLFPKSVIVNAYYQTEKDEQYIKSHPVLSFDFEMFISWFKAWRAGKDLDHNIGLAAWYREFEGVTQGHTGVVLGSKAKLKNIRLYSEQVVAHEYFHVVQDYYKYERDRKGYEGEDEFANYYPPIFREGSANTISFGVSMQSFEDYLLFYQTFLAENIGKYQPKIFNSLTSKSKVISTLNLIEKRSNDPDAHWASYSLGALTFEWFIAKYGIEAFKRLIFNQKLGKTFEENIKISAGITLDQLYEGAAEHVFLGFNAAKAAKSFS